MRHCSCSFDVRPHQELSALVELTDVHLSPIHIALFISACRRTHQQRLFRLLDRKSEKDLQAQEVARAMMAQMTENGQLPLFQRLLLAAEQAPQASTTRNPSPNPQAELSSLENHPAVPLQIHVAPSSQV